MRSLVIRNSSQNGEITLSFTDIGKSCHCHKLLFRKTAHMRSLVIRNSSQNGEITLSFTDIGKSCHCHKLLALQVSLLTLFRKMKFW